MSVIQNLLFTYNGIKAYLIINELEFGEKTVSDSRLVNKTSATS